MSAGIDITKALQALDWILYVGTVPHKDEHSARFRSGYQWELSATSKNHTVTFRENRFYGLRKEAFDAAQKFALQYKLNIKDSKV